MKIKRFFGLLLLGLQLNSCCCHHLNVQTQYLSRENLASHYIYTPDPHLDTPVIGQRLLIQWSLPTSYLYYKNLQLHLRVRFPNHQEEQMAIPVKKKWGTYLYFVVNQAYCKTGGFNTYRVDLIADGCILDSWKHPLWVDLITLNVPNNPTNTPTPKD